MMENDSRALISNVAEELQVPNRSVRREDLDGYISVLFQNPGWPDRGKTAGTELVHDGVYVTQYV